MLTFRKVMIYGGFFLLVLIALAGTVFLSMRAYRFQGVYNEEMAKSNASNGSAP